MKKEIINLPELHLIYENFHVKKGLRHIVFTLSVGTP